jgi:hypothetical protein
MHATIARLGAAFGNLSPKRRANTSHPTTAPGDDETDDDASGWDELVPGANGVASTSFMPAARSAAALRYTYHTHHRSPAARQIEAERPPMPTGEELTKAVEKLRVQHLTRLPEGVLTGSSFECALCLEPANAGHHVRRLACMHTFHTQCIDQWIMTEQAGTRRRCPLCNADPVTGVVAHDGADNDSAHHAPSGITFGGVPVEQLLPRWALGSIGGDGPDERRAQQPALSYHPVHHDGIRQPGASPRRHSSGLAALYA